jgi:chromosome partitioning protein
VPDRRRTANRLVLNSGPVAADQDTVLGRSIAVCNGKGGAGKTSVSAHLAGAAAASGWRVLAVDLDPQGNLGQDLGYLQAGRSDGGDGLAAAVARGVPPEPVRAVRPNLDVIPAGEGTERLQDHLYKEWLRSPAGLLRLGEVLAPVVSGYHLVVFDCPPGDRVLLDAALSASRFVLIPTQVDDGSVSGLQRVARRFLSVRAATNPTLELLGVCLFNVGAGDTRIHAEVRSELDAALAGVAPVFDAVVRHARKASRDMRRRGELAFEYQQAAASAVPWYASPDAAGDRFAGNAAGLAEDYVALCTAVLRRVAERVTAQPVVAA